MYHRSTGTTSDRGRRGERGERGASLVEYALLLALIAIVSFAAVSFLGTSTGGSVDRSGQCMEAAANGTALPANCSP